MSVDLVDGTEVAAPFSLRLENFEGPFDLLLSLISKHKLDVTEIALSKVTDEFIAHIKAKGPVWDLGQATEFLVVDRGRLVREAMALVLADLELNGEASALVRLLNLDE